MANEIIRFNYLSLRRSEQYHFNAQILRIIEAVFPHSESWAKQIKNFKKAVSRLAAALVSLQSRGRLSLKALDKMTDQSWHGMQLQIKASLLLPESAEAAAKVEDIFNRTPKPVRKKYEDEYGALDTMVQAIESLGADVLAASRCDKHLAHMKVCVQNFTEAQSQKFEQLNARQTGEIIEAGNECTASWQSLIKYLEAMAEGELLDGAEEAIDRINVVTSYVRSRLNKRSKMDDDAAAKDTEILADDAEAENAENKETAEPAEESANNE